MKSQSASRIPASAAKRVWRKSIDSYFPDPDVRPVKESVQFWWDGPLEFKEGGCPHSCAQSNTLCMPIYPGSQCW